MSDGKSRINFLIGFKWTCFIVLLSTIIGFIVQNYMMETRGAGTTIVMEIVSLPGLLLQIFGGILVFSLLSYLASREHYLISKQKNITGIFSSILAFCLFYIFGFIITGKLDVYFGVIYLLAGIAGGYSGGLKEIQGVKTRNVLIDKILPIICLILAFGILYYPYMPKDMFAAPREMPENWEKFTDPYFGYSLEIPDYFDFKSRDDSTTNLYKSSAESMINGSKAPDVSVLFNRIKSDQEEPEINDDFISIFMEFREDSLQEHLNAKEKEYLEYTSVTLEKMISEIQNIQGKNWAILCHYSLSGEDRKVCRAFTFCDETVAVQIIYADPTSTFNEEIFNRIIGSFEC